MSFHQKFTSVPGNGTSIGPISHSLQPHLGLPFHQSSEQQPKKKTLRCRHPSRTSLIQREQKGVLFPSTGWRISLLMERALASIWEIRSSSGAQENNQVNLSGTLGSQGMMQRHWQAFNNDSRIVFLRGGLQIPLLTALRLLTESGGLDVFIRLVSSCQWPNTWLAKALAGFRLLVL